jgi:transcriptional regulator with XRE-family HTH domain
MNRFGEKLRTLRKRQGLSQSEVGDMLDVAQSFVARIENGRQKPSVDLILKISYIFNVSADTLMKDELELED